VDVAALATALAGGGVGTEAGTTAAAGDAEGTEGGAVAGPPWQRLDLERQLREREQELAAALARIAGLEDALQAQAQKDGGGEGGAPSRGPAA